MSARTKKHESGCLVAHAVDLLGDRWVLLLLRDMMLYGKQTYGEFLAAGEGIATNVLAERLQHLEAAGIVTKTRDPDNRRSSLYRLTEKGLGLAPALLEIIRWSGGHRRLTASRRKLIERIEEDRDGLLAEIRARCQSGAART